MRANNVKLMELPKGGKSPIALVVDDEESICETLADVLEDEQFETISVHDGEAAVLMVQEHNPDIVFLDIWMAGSDGLETLEKIKTLSPFTEVIMMSGHASIANALEATKRGAFDFIEKPLDLETIILSTRRALERRKASLDTEKALQANTNGVSMSEQGKIPLLKHPGVCSTGLKGNNLGQRTLRRSVVLYGQGLHSGQKSGLVLEPLPQNSGVHFANIGGSKVVPAFIDYVESTDFATTLRHGGTATGAMAQTIEHLMATLHAYRVSNVLIKCNGEVPILDGSAREFCERLEDVGLTEQGGEWYELAIDEATSCAVTGPNGSKESISIEPSDRFSISYELWYPEPVGKQFYHFDLDSTESFKREIAPARTFGFMKDIERLQKAGLAAGGRLDNFVLIDSEKVVNTTLRFPDEQVRHKILDIIGDIFLLGRPIRGKITARMTGHSDNIELLKKIKGAIF